MVWGTCISKYFILVPCSNRWAFSCLMIFCTKLRVSLRLCVCRDAQMAREMGVLSSVTLELGLLMTPTRMLVLDFCKWRWGRKGCHWRWPVLFFLVQYWHFEYLYESADTDHLKPNFKLNWKRGYTLAESIPINLHYSNYIFCAFDLY